MKVTKAIQTLCVFTLAIFVNSNFAAADRPDIDRRDGVITITGTTAEDHCVVFIDGDEVEVFVRYYDKDDERWRETDRDYQLDRVNQIVFMGGSGDDLIVNDTNIPMVAYGGYGDDRLVGGGGGDDLYGGPGWDSLDGSGGRDYLKAGDYVEDENSVVGGDGIDIFVTPYLYRGYGFFLQRVESTYEFSDFDPNRDREQFFYSFNWFSFLR